jgi:hypothetical protein
MDHTIPPLSLAFFFRHEIDQYARDAEERIVYTRFLSSFSMKAEWTFLFSPKALLAFFLSEASCARGLEKLGKIDMVSVMHISFYDGVVPCRGEGAGL